MKKPSHFTMPLSRHIRPTFRAIFRRPGGLSSTINLKRLASSTRKGDALLGKRTDLFLETPDWEALNDGAVLSHSLTFPNT
jgi:hypothetical protein